MNCVHGVSMHHPCLKCRHATTPRALADAQREALEIMKRLEEECIRLMAPSPRPRPRPNLTLIQGGKA